MESAVTYIRVSGRKQQKSGLSIEAQRERIRLYAASNNFIIVKEFVEVKSGLKRNRPIANECIEFCKPNNVRILIAEQDRLSRSVLFIATLIHSKVPFTNVDSPNDSEFVIYIKAAVSQYEAELTSKRTIAALAAAKRRGIVLGKTCHELNRRKKTALDVFAREMIPIIQGFRRRGIITIRGIMAELNRINIPTFQGEFRWHITTVYSLLKRIRVLQGSPEQISNRETNSLKI